MLFFAHFSADASFMSPIRSRNSFSIRFSFSLTVIYAVVFWAVAMTCPQLLILVFNDDPEVIAFGMIRMGICCVFQCIGGLMGVMVGVLRGMGYSLVPMAITIGFVCGFRVIWIFTIFVGWHTLESLYVSYPITWGLAALCDGICFFVVNKHLKKKLALAKERA